MAQTQDYRKPRNKELRDLLVGLSQPIRITDPKGEIAWQNRAAEQLEAEPQWDSQPTTWQGKKALLLVPAQDDSQVDARVQELEAEIDRLKRHQRATAKKKKQAEDAARRREKSVAGVEKREERLRSQLDCVKKELKEVKKRLTKETKKAAKQAEGPTKADLKKLEREVQKLQRQLDKKVAAENVHKETAKSLKSLERENKKLEAALAKKQTGSANDKRVKELEKQNKELQEWALVLEQDKREPSDPETAQELERLRAELEKNETQQREAEQRYQDLRDDFDEFRLSAEETEQKWSSKLLAAGSPEELTQLRGELEESQQAYGKLEQEFQSFRQQTEDAAAERALEEQLEQKVKELEELERSFEEEQSAFSQQKSELESKLAEQEGEFKRLKEEISGEHSALSEDDIEELKEELEDAKTDLVLATRREIRLSEKIEGLEDLKDEQSQLLENLKGDLEQARQREKELKETVDLYADLRDDLEESRRTVKGLRGKVKSLEGQTEELQSKLESQAAALEKSSPDAVTVKLRRDATSPGLSKTLQQQLDFAKKRLHETEQKLDRTVAELKQEKAQSQSSKEAEKLAFQDTLTGLPNRNMVDRYLDYSYQKAQSQDRAIALFLIDLDGFRVFNDTFGREWGDQLLKAVGERLAGMRGGSHIFARHSKDRFMLLAANLEKVGAVKFIQDASKSILDALAYPFEVVGETVNLTGTIGVCLGPTVGEDASVLYRDAERALQSAKAKGASSFHLFDDSLRQLAQRDAAYKRQMEHALSRDEFEPLYQPILDLDKGITGVELLLRWNHRDQKTLKPEDFLDAAIDSGMIFAITQEIWPKAFKALARWRKARKGLTLSLNLSDREMLSPALLDRATGWLKDAGVDPSAIIFEVRDGSRLRISSSWWPTLEKIRSRGFGLCLDDFGSEGSLFGTLAYVGFKQAKVSVGGGKGSFVTRPPGAAKGILYCAKGLQGRLDKKGLKKAGFDQVQGFGLAPPLEESEVDKFLS